MTGYLMAPTRPRRALAKLTLTEAKLLLREPVTLLWGLAFPAALLTVMGLASSGAQSDVGGQRLVAVYEPIVIAFVTVALAVQVLPALLAGYRERRVLRRLATTPVGPARVIAAQLAVNMALALAATAGVLTVGRCSPSAWHCPGSSPLSSSRTYWPPRRCSAWGC